MNASPRNILFGFIALSLAFIFALPSVAALGPFGLISVGMGYMTVFFHEIGHTLFAWLYGIPTFPIFDFKYGGGFAVSLTDRSWGGQIFVWAVMVYGLYQLRDRMPSMFFYPLVTFCAVTGLIGLTDFYEDVVLFMGHGTVAVLGGFMLARGFYGVFLTRPSERWFNVFVGAFFILDQIKMCNALLHDVAFQMQYESQKGGHGFGDLTRIANNHYPWTQDGLAIFLMMFTILMGVAIPIYVGKLVKDHPAE